jgi:aspartate/methionine/tyrosine aminotransferase
MGERAAEVTEDWSLPRAARPPLLGELVERIDEALATARASEAAVMTVGAAALDAAEQARRAAELAERASSAMNRGAVSAATHAVQSRVQAPPEEAGMDSFTARADRVAERLRRLQRLPLSV